MLGHHVSSFNLNHIDESMVAEVGAFTACSLHHRPVPQVLNANNHLPQAHMVFINQDPGLLLALFQAVPVMSTPLLGSLTGLGSILETTPAELGGN